MANQLGRRRSGLLRHGAGTAGTLARRLPTGGGVGDGQRHSTPAQSRAQWSPARSAGFAYPKCPSVPARLSHMTTARTQHELKSSS
eukprot:9943547-Alexandrium_andersonii.AAC.1